MHFDVKEGRIAIVGENALHTFDRKERVWLSSDIKMGEIETK